MDKKEDIVIDQWEIKLDQKLLELKECQSKETLKSCNPCDKFFECDLRKKYVLAVYASMNKGSNGGFEF